jgi:hypothetical protein
MGHHALGVHLFAQRFTTRWLISNWRCSSIPTSRRRRDLHSDTRAIAVAGKGATWPPAARDPFSALYHGIAFYAQFLGDNYVEAIRLAREATRQRSDFLGGHRVLTAAAGPMFAGLDRSGNADETRGQPRTLPRRFRRSRLYWTRRDIGSIQRDHWL